MGTLLLIVVYFIVFLVQFSFVPAAFPFLVLPNLLFVLTILYLMVEDPDKKRGLFLAFFGGFLNDVVSTDVFGLYIFIFLISAYVLKFIFKYYVQLPFLQKV